MNPEESLDIISRMMSQTRRSVLQQSHRPFLIWGWCTLIISVTIYAGLNVTGCDRWHYLWLALPIAGTSLTYARNDKGTPVRTAATIALRSIWIMLTVVTVSFSIASYFVRYNALFIILLLLSIGCFTTGAVIGYNFLQRSSLAGFAGAAAMLLVGGTAQLPLFGAAIGAMMIIPGYRMKNDLISTSDERT